MLKSQGVQHAVHKQSGIQRPVPGLRLMVYFHVHDSIGSHGK
jgi:hypothetical protein